MPWTCDTLDFCNVRVKPAVNVVAGENVSLYGARFIPIEQLIVIGYSLFGATLPTIWYLYYWWNTVLVPEQPETINR